MSYYTNDSEIERENGGGLHKVSVAFNLIICICYCFLVKEAIVSLWNIIDIRNFFKGFALVPAVMNILVIAELIIWIIALIFTLARLPNEMLGKVFAIFVFGLVLNCVLEMDMNEWEMSTGTMVEYALTIGGYFCLVWILLTNKIELARQIRALPGILMCLASYKCVMNFSTFIDRSFASVSAFVTMFLLPLSIIMYMFCFANWASKREEPVVEEKKKKPYVPVQTANLKPLDIPQSSEEAAKMTCRYCGAPKNLKDRVCPRCGREDKSNEE